jgi:hypothetical protein
MRKFARILSFVAAAAILGSAGTGYAALLAKSPVITPGGYPSWFQDQTGLALQGCLNDPPLPTSFCFLPDGIIEQPGFLPNEPKDFPGNFPIEHFYFLASNGEPIALPNGSFATEVEFAVEAAFNPEIIANPNQEMFHRLRLIFSPNIAAGPGTYTIVHPWGTTVIPPELQQQPFGVGGPRGRATIDVNIGSAAGNLASTNDNFQGVLGNDPLFTISNYLTQTTPAPPVGYLGDCLTASTVTGGPNGNTITILGPNNEVVGQSDLFVVCGQKTGLEASPASFDFGLWKSTASTPTTFTVTNLTGVDIPARNTGADPVEGLILTSDNPVFTIPAATDTCANGVAALPPDNTCTFEVVFTPTADGPASGVITMASNGNPNATVSVTGTGDVTPPVLTVGQNLFTNALQATISGTATDNVAVHDILVSLGGVLQGTSTVTDTNWSFIVSGFTQNSPNVFTVTAMDTAQPLNDGNTATQTVTVTHDNILPVVDVTPIAALANNQTPTLTFTVTETNLASTVVKLDGAIVNVLSGQTLGPLADGAHTVTIDATDSATNLTTGTTAFTVDSIHPVITVVSPKINNARVGQATPALTVTVDDANPVPANLAVTLDGTDVTANATLGPFTAGSAHTLVVTTTDGAGNLSTTTLPFTIVFADGRITTLGAADPAIADALLALRHAISLITLDADQFAHGDVAPLDLNGIPQPDGAVDIADALIILRRVVGLITTF